MEKFSAAVIAVFLVSDCPAEELRVLTWNVESSRDTPHNDPAVIAKQLGELQRDFGPFDLIGLTEVRESNWKQYATAIQPPNGPDLVVQLSDTGGSDRMLIAWSKKRFELRSRDLALTAHDGVTFPGGFNRRPLLATLSDRKNNGLVLTFMVNHLTRGNDQARQRQARLLREWVKDHPHPVIAVGDYNFDFDTVHLCGNQSMSIFMRDEASDRGRFAWRWVMPGVETTVTDYRKPSEAVEIIGTFRDSNWDGDRSGRDRYPTSILDFVFLGGDAMEWKASSKVIVREGDFPDDERTSDHRPVMAVVEP